MLLLFLGATGSDETGVTTGTPGVATGTGIGLGLGLGIILENIPNIEDISFPGAAFGADVVGAAGVLATLPACWKMADDTNVIIIVISGPNDVLPDHL